MFKGFAASVGVVVTLIVGGSVLSVSGVGQNVDGGTDGQKKNNYVTPKNRWGDPDLQGFYTTNDGAVVPCKRPSKFCSRMYLTDEEFKERDLQAKKAAEDNKEDRHQLAAGDTGDGPEHWYERGKTSRRTSLVVDPPDGRIPLTPAMKKRYDDWAKAQRYGNDNPSYVDFDLWDRCITKGFPTVMVPMGYNNAYKILQTP